MAIGYKFIASSTVGSGGVTSVTFSSIAAIYTDLVVKMSARDGSSNGTIYVCINGTTQTNQTMKRLEGNGASATSDSQSSIYFTMDYASHTANTFGSAEMYIPNYTSSNNKSISIDAIEENNATTAYSDLVAGLWSQTAAITSLNFQCNASFAQYTTFYLYGITKY